MKNNIDIQNPISHTIASKASQYNQDKYMFWKKLEFFSIVTAAIFSIYLIEFKEYNFSAIFSGLALSFALGVIYYEKSFGHREGWFKCRVFVEAIKSESWKFRTACGNYMQDKDDTQAIKNFLFFLSTVRKSLGVSNYVASFNVQGDDVTQEMLSSRKLSKGDRISNYRFNRIERQMKWYFDKANDTHNKFKIFFNIMSFSLFIGIIISIIQFLGYFSNYSLVGVFSALAASISGWVQVQRYETLAISYTKASEELRQMSQLSSTIKNEEGLCNLVNNAEMIISKEHTTWTQFLQQNP